MGQGAWHHGTAQGGCVVTMVHQRSHACLSGVKMQARSWPRISVFFIVLGYLAGIPSAVTPSKHAGASLALTPPGGRVANGDAGPALTLMGVVSDAATHRPIVHARVSVEGKSALTALDGHYVMIIAAGETFHYRITAQNYTIETGLVTTRSVISGLAQFDFRLTKGNRHIVLSGVVRDAETGQPIPGATVTSGEGQSITDSKGHYALTATATTRLQLEVTALGYMWAPPYVVTRRDKHVMSGRFTVNFSGNKGLYSVFRTAMGDTLSPFSQVLAPHTRRLAVTVHNGQAISTDSAVTYPDGDAALLPLVRAKGGYYRATVTFDRGYGVYQFEIYDMRGFALFNVPFYYGVPYTPPEPQRMYPPDSATASPSQLEEAALTIVNDLRKRFGRGILRVDPRIGTVARAHSIDMAVHGYYDEHPHIGSDASTPGVRLQAAHVRSARVAEDVGRAASIRGVIGSMLASASHRAALLYAGFSRVGIGAARQQDGNIVLTIDLAG